MPEVNIAYSVQLNPRNRKRGSFSTALLSLVFSRRANHVLQLTIRLNKGSHGSVYMLG